MALCCCAAVDVVDITGSDPLWSFQKTKISLCDIIIINLM